MTRLTGSTNRIYKTIKSLLTHKGRQINRRFLVEGERSVLDAIAAGAEMATVVVSDTYSDRGGDHLEAMERRGIELFCVKDSLFEGLCDTQNPQGILGVVHILPPREIPFRRGGLYLYCDRISDPGNAGTIIRTADAVAAAGVLFSPDSVDLYNPKVIRATMGSLFHLPVRADSDIFVLDSFRKAGYTILAGALSAGALDYREAPMEKNCVIVIGNEAQGVSADGLKRAHHLVKIPIAGRAESLNASVAAGVLCYEWLRRAVNNE